MASLIVCPHGSAAREAMREAVRGAKRRDPIAPVTVVVPTTYAGLSLRRWLARDNGFVNVRFTVLPRLAELLGAPSLAAEAGRRPLTDILRGEAVRTVLSAARPPLAGAARHPATERSLDASFRELRRAPASRLDELAAQNERCAVVVGLYREFRRVTARFYDEDDLAEAAARIVAARAPAALDELGPVVLYLPLSLSPAEGAFVDALAARGHVTAIVGCTGDATADAAAGELATRLVAVLGSPATGMISATPAATGIVSAPDPEDEVREVVRLVLARAAGGTPLHRMAVLYGSTDPYARLAAGLLEDAGVPWSGRATRRLGDSVAGRVLLGLLALPDGGWARDDVAAWLASGPVVDPVSGRRVPAARWDVVSRAAGIVAGLDQWTGRLERFARGRAADLTAATDDDSMTDGARRALEADVEDATSLREFVTGLASRMAPPEPATWPGLARWARSLLLTYLGGEGRRRDWPEVELEAARLVTSTLDTLGALGQITDRTELGKFVRALGSELDGPIGRAGRFGAGVLVGPLRHAYGGDFDAIFVLGMAEGSFPSRGAEDPLLPDRDRDGAGSGLPLHTERRADDRRDYLAALAAATERVLCFPRADPRAQRKRLPARWLVDGAGELAGRRLGADELASIPASTPWLRVIPSFEGGVRGDTEPASPTERDMRALTGWVARGRRLADHALVVSTPALAAGVAAADARASDRFSRFDGFVGARAAVPAEDGRTLTPTALEDWARCGFRHLLGRTLHLREIARPEEVDAISPLERGALVHGILEEFIRSVSPPAAPTVRWSEGERATLLAIARRRCDDAEEAGLTGRRLLWQLERRRILRALRTFLDVDEAVRAAHGVAPVRGGQEIGFGRDGDALPLVAVTLADGRRARFRGRIDRVDRSPDGARALVLDYKTGTGWRSGDPLRELAAGLRLQLPVYALAAEASGAHDVHASYWYVDAPPDRALHGYRLDDMRDAFRDVLGTVLEGIGGGVFPAFPGEPRQDGRGRDTWVNCCYCPFDRVCPSERDRAWERKRGDERVAVFRGLADPEDEEDGG